MQTVDTQILLNELKQINASCLRFVEDKLQDLSDQQLKWKPNAKSWSILEVFAHLNAHAHYYQNIIHKKIIEHKGTEPSAIFVSSPLGRATWRLVQLGKMRNIKRRVKSARVFNPEYFGLDIERQEMQVFLEYLKGMVQILAEAEQVNLRKIKLPMAVSKFVYLRLGDALMFHVYHNDRHVEQINQLLNHKKFPK
jgi:hypothetical protein